MGKRIDQLALNDNPIERQTDVAEARAAAADTDLADLRTQEWFQLVGEIDELLASDVYLFAHETLEGIKHTVETTHRVSAGQRRAVDNIRAPGDPYKHRRPFKRWR